LARHVDLPKLPIIASKEEYAKPERESGRRIAVASRLPERLLEREPRDNLARPRFGPGARDRVDVAQAAGVLAGCILRRCGGKRDRRAGCPLVAGRRRREEESVPDILELGADEEVVLAFMTEAEVAPEAHRFGGLPLPAQVVEEGSRTPPLAR